MTYLLVLFLASSEIATFHTTRELCMETLEAHQAGALVIAWDAQGKEWPAERVLCLEPVETETETPTS